MGRFREFFPRVVQFGPPRTGSTLVWNAMRVMLPGETIPKRHDLNPMLRRGWFGVKIVCTVRNPLDAIASSIRRYRLEPSNTVIASQIDEFRRNGMEELPGLVERGHVLILKYEEFHHDFDHLFDRLEPFLGVEAASGLRRDFKEEFSVERVKEKTDRLGGFEAFSSDDLFHGGHVSDRFGKPGGYAELLDADAVRRIREAFAWHFERFGW